MPRRTAKETHVYMSHDWRGTIQSPEPVMVYRERRRGWLARLREWFTDRRESISKRVRR